MNGNRREDDLRMEEAIGRILKIGVAVSSACLVAGLVLMMTGALPSSTDRLLAIGIVVLLATPGARVVVSFLEYSIHRDWLFAVLTAVVLLELAISVVAAMNGVRV
jgi:uncharacterized membrane protein